MTGDRADELRAAFDRGFAEPPAGPRAQPIDVLRIRLGDEAFVVALAEVAALHVERPMCAVPTSVRELVGVAAVGPAIVPVYDLAAMIGVHADHPPRWLAIAGGGSVGFAFHAFDGLARVDALPPVAATGGFLRGVLADAGRSIPVIDLAAITRSVLQRRER